MKRYVTAQDIVIPAGTPLDPAPARIEYADSDGRPAMATGKPAATLMAVIGPTKDTTFTWHMHVNDGLDAGLIREAE